MDRRERRRRKRLKAKLEANLEKGAIAPSSSKEASQQHKDTKGLAPPQSLARRYFFKATSRTKKIWPLLAAVLTLLGAYRFSRPHISVDPELLLDPSDPFSTQFSVKNENAIFAVKDLRPSCYTLFVHTDHDFELRGMPPRPSKPIPMIGPEEKSTIDCPPWVSGFGSGAGNILRAYIEIDVSYKQSWWPAAQIQRFPFKGVRDSRSGVHWIHRTPTDLE